MGLRGKLSPIQQRFCDLYLKKPIASRAAYQAGYNKAGANVQATRLLKNPKVQAYLEKRLSEMSKKNIMDATEAMELLTKIARGEEEETIVMPTGDGVYRGKKEADTKTRIAAAKEILKRYPSANPLYAAQIKKAKAEATLAEAKAKADSTDEKVVINVTVPEND